MQYAVLFRIECLHEYFGGACRSLSLSPTQDCSTLLERYRMLFRGSPGGGAVYAPMQSPSRLLQRFDEAFPLTFMLHSTDAVLNSYTDFASSEDADPAETLFYFDNAADHQANVFGNSRQLLHSAGNPFADAALVVRPKMFNFLPLTKSSSGPLQVIEPVANQVLWQCPVSNLVNPVPLNLRRQLDGRYVLKVDKQEWLNFYLSNKPASQQWGAISIYLGGSQLAQALPTNCRVIDSAGVVTPKTFTLALDNRKTIWRYYVIDSAGKQDFSKYELTAESRKSSPAEPNAGSELSFKRLPDPVPIDGRTAWVFESQSPLPLLHTPSTEFSLTLRPNGNGKRGDRTVRLPYAQPVSLAFKDEKGTRPFCSEIFVYF